MLHKRNYDAILMQFRAICVLSSAPTSPPDKLGTGASGPEKKSQGHHPGRAGNRDME